MNPFPITFKHLHPTNHHSIFIQPFPKRQILDSSKLKEFADDNFKFDENCGKFSESIENTVGKGEIARNKQFLLFPQCFLKTYTAGKRVNLSQANAFNFIL